VAWSFGDGFDLYALPADTVNGYWDSGSTGSFLLGAGRFSGSQALYSTNGALYLAKSSGVNDAVHHLVVAFRQTGVVSGSNLYTYLQLLDGTTGQCAVVFRQDGAILLTSGTSVGTVLDTYTGASPVINTWYTFEIEIVINNTTGSWAVRKNGNTSNDHALGGLNTRPTSTNNYANKLQVGCNVGAATQNIDDLFWRSDASSVAWMGDIRCNTRMPITTSSAQFSQVGTIPSQAVSTTLAAGQALAANSAHYMPFVANRSGNVVSGSIRCDASGGGGTGHFTVALFAVGTGGSIGTLLATSTQVTNPTTTAVAFVFPSPAYITVGQSYWIGINQDASITYNVANQAGSIVLTTPVYASWPASNPGGTAGANNCQAVTINLAPLYNSDVVSEPQEDGLTSYVYDSTVNDADFYTIGTLTPVPSTIFAVVTRGYMIKSDAGSRTASVRTKSGTTTVSTPTLTLSTSGWQWAWRTDVVDPNTGSAWVGSAVDAITVGPLVVS
jgi:hypothetical protein